MEHNLINNISKKYNINLTERQADILCRFAEAIYNSNKHFNLTGLKDIQSIFEVLIIKSIQPVSLQNVPRGTFFLDIGTGAGVPGIPLAVYFENFQGLLIDSNQKKISFIKDIVDELQIDNIEISCSRVEDLAKDNNYREKFQWVFSRGVGEPFLAMELGAAFVEVGGLMVLYSNEEHEEISKGLREVSFKYGLDVLSGEEKKKHQVTGNVIVMKKNEMTDDKFPRRYSVIKRESKLFLKQGL